MLGYRLASQFRGSRTIISYAPLGSNPGILSKGQAQLQAAGPRAFLRLKTGCAHPPEGSPYEPSRCARRTCGGMFLLGRQGIP